MLALRFILYTLKLPLAHYARRAFKDTRLLPTAGRPSYIGDLFRLLHVQR